MNEFITTKRTFKRPACGCIYCDVCDAPLDYGEGYFIKFNPGTKRYTPSREHDIVCSEECVNLFILEYA